MVVAVRGSEGTCKQQKVMQGGCGAREEGSRACVVGAGSRREETEASDAGTASRRRRGKEREGPA